MGLDPWQCGWEWDLPNTLLVSVTCSVVPDSLWPHGLQPSRLLCSWDFPGKDTGVGSPSFLQGIFPAQESNLGLPHCRWIFYQLSHEGSPWDHHRCSKFGGFKTRGQNLDPKIMEKGAVSNQSQEMIYGKQFCGCPTQVNSWSLNSTKNGNSGRFYFLGLQNHCGWWL